MLVSPLSFSWQKTLADAFCLFIDTAVFNISESLRKTKRNKRDWYGTVNSLMGQAIISLPIGK